MRDEKGRRVLWLIRNLDAAGTLVFIVAGGLGAREISGILSGVLLMEDCYR